MPRINRAIKKGLNDLDNHNGVVTNLELDILECDVVHKVGLKKHCYEQNYRRLWNSS